MLWMQYLLKSLRRLTKAVVAAANVMAFKLSLVLAGLFFFQEDENISSAIGSLSAKMSRFSVVLPKK